MPPYQHIIFDLDGTLIDSAPAILASFRAAFAATGREPVVAIDESIIGPPLAETLALLSGTVDPAVIGDLSRRFAAVYDTTGYLETAAYPGVGDMLRRLAGRGLRLHIATNKRIHPTRKILAQLGWDGLFDNVYALDLFTPRLPHKAAMIARLLADCGIPAKAAVYVGDREEDGLSADANHLPFLATTWGYGSLQAKDLRSGWTAVRQPAALLRP
jgi:phosphoglycolate phosphatase